MKLKDTGERLIVYKHSERNPLYLRSLTAYRFALPFIRDKCVLDDGSGSGYGSYYLATNGAKKVVGTDLSKDAVEYAKNRYKDKNLEFMVSDAGYLTFDDETFDVVTSFQVIEHIEDASRFLREIIRVLKKTGIALISTPNKRTFSPDTTGPENPFHKKEFYFDEFDRLLKVHFSEVEIFGVNQSQKLHKADKTCRTLVKKNIKPFLTKLRLHFLLKMVPKRLVDSLLQQFYGNITLSDFTVTKSDLENVLDFIAVCRKS